MAHITPLQDEAYEFIKRQIREGNFEQDRFYSLSAVAAMLNMSKTPVRDALQKLSQEELIEILPSRGFRLQQASSREIIELYQLRCAIEGYCSYLLAMRNQSEPGCPEIEKMRQSLSKQAEIIAAGCSPADFLPLDREFHGIITASAGNRRFGSIMDNNRTRISDFALYALKTEDILDITLREHNAVFAAICSMDPIASQSAMLAHLRTPLDMNLGGQSTR